MVKVKLFITIEIDEEEYPIPADLIKIMSVSVKDTSDLKYKKIRRLVQQPMILNSCNATYDDKFTWEIDKGMRVPQQCKLSLSWAWIGDQFPRMGAKFVQFDRGSQEGVKKGS